jgi:hypothetical protein
MKLNTRMPTKLCSYYTKELLDYKDAMGDGNLKRAWYHLEKAHILGQRYPYQHTVVHWNMLLFGIKIKSLKEVLGQIPRLMVGGVKSFVGKIPNGNPGGANVPAFKAFPISKELQDVFDSSGISILK